MTTNTAPKCRPIIAIAGGRGKTTVAYMIGNILGAHRTLVLHFDESTKFGVLTRLWQRFPEDAVLVAVDLGSAATLSKCKLGKVWGIQDGDEDLGLADACDVVLHNDGTLADLEAQVRAALAKEGLIK